MIEPDELIVTESHSNFNGYGVSCFESCDAEINLEISGGCEPYEYSWSGPDGFTSNEQNISNICSGSYSVTVTDANGNITSEDNIVITEPEDIIITEFLESNYCEYNFACNGDVAGSYIEILSVSGGTPFINDEGETYYEYFWQDTDNNTQNIYDILPGTYTLIITDSNGCSKDFEFTITEPDEITVNIVTTLATNCLSDGTAVAEINGGCEPYIVNWYEDINENEIFDEEDIIVQEGEELTTISGTYRINIIDSNGCTEDLEVNIDQTPEMEGNLTLFYLLDQPGCFGSASMVYTGGGCDPSSVADVEPSWIQWLYDVDCDGIPDGECNFDTGVGFDLVISDDPFNPVIDDLTAGCYIAMLVDPCGCPEYLPFEIESFPELSLASTTTSLDEFNDFAISCCGENDAYINLGITGGSQAAVCGTEFYDIIWFDDLNLNGEFDEETEASTIWSTDQNLSDLSPGIYTVQVTDCVVTQCPVVQTFNLTNIPECVEAEVFTFNVDCNYNPLIPASAELEVTGGTGSYTYQWSNLDSPWASTAESVSPLAPGQYEVIVTDENGCTADTINFTIDDIVGFDYSYDGNVIVDATIENVDCTGNNTGSINNITLYSDGIPILESDGIFSVEWGSYDPNNLYAGTYTVSITNTTTTPPCTFTHNFTVNEPNPLIVSSSDYATCGGCPTMATIFVDGGTPPYQDEWYQFNESTLTYDLIEDPDDNDVNGFGTNGYNNFLSPGNYQVIITDYNGCQESWTFNIFDEPIPTEWASVETIETCGTGNCDGIASLEIDFDIADDIIYIPNWINCEGELLTTVENDPLTVENLCAGEYTCQILNSVTNEIQSICFTIEDGNFSIEPEVENISCFGQNDGFIDLNISGGTPPYIVDWSDGVTLIGNDERENLPPGIISVDIFDANNNCVIEQEFTIIEPIELTVPPPILLEVLGGWNTSCEEGCDGSIQVNVVGGTAPYNYFWNGIEVISNSFSYAEIVNGLCAGEGQLGIIDANGCQVQHNITLDSPPQMIVNVDSFNDVSCSEEEEGIINDGSINISVTGGQPPYSYAWYNEDGDLISTNQDVNGLVQGEYTVIVNDINGNVACGVSTDPNPFPIDDPFNFEINPPLWGLADGPAACEDANDGYISLEPSGGTPYIDDNNESYYTYFLNGDGPYILYIDEIEVDENTSSNGTIENLTVGEYELVLFDFNGCQITHNFEVDSIEESCLLDIPTVFTPNGDGTNDEWVVNDLLFYPDATVQIYNRWGQLVFDCNNNCYFNSWDGTYEGENLPFGNYYFLINYKENEEPIYGAVTIKR